MPLELRKAHQANDKAVMATYGFPPKMTEIEIVAELGMLISQHSIFLQRFLEHPCNPKPLEKSYNGNTLRGWQTDHRA